jgi:hypothetical protein
MTTVLLYFVISAIALVIIYFRRFSWYWTVLVVTVIVAVLWGLDFNTVVNVFVGPAASNFAVEIGPLLTGGIFFAATKYLGIQTMFSRMVKVEKASSRIALVIAFTLVSFGILMITQNIGAFYVVATFMLPILAANGVGTVTAVSSLVASVGFSSIWWPSTWTMIQRTGVTSVSSYTTFLTAVSAIGMIGSMAYSAFMVNRQAAHPEKESKSEVEEFVSSRGMTTMVGLETRQAAKEIVAPTYSVVVPIIPIALMIIGWQNIPSIVIGILAAYIAVYPITGLGLRASAAVTERNFFEGILSQARSCIALFMVGIAAAPVLQSPVIASSISSVFGSVTLSISTLFVVAIVLLVLSLFRGVGSLYGAGMVVFSSLIKANLGIRNATWVGIIVVLWAFMFSTDITMPHQLFASSISGGDEIRILRQRFPLTLALAVIMLALAMVMI